MKHLTTIIFLYSLLVAKPLSAQIEDERKFNLSISGGIANPVGTFALADAANSVVFNEELLPYESIRFFNKSKSGFARAGNYYALQLNYYLKDNWFLITRFGETNNSIDTDVISEFIRQHYEWDDSNIFTHEDYKITNLSSGIGYAIKKNNWKFNIALLAGLAKVNYPYYQDFIPFEDNPNDGRVWAHYGERPDLFSFMGGGGMKVSYQINHFSVGVEIVYQYANFDYEINTAIKPAGNDYPERTDRLKTSLLNTGLLFSYAFGKKTPTRVALR